MLVSCVAYKQVGFLSRCAGHGDICRLSDVVMKVARGAELGWVEREHTHADRDTYDRGAGRVVCEHRQQCKCRSCTLSLCACVCVTRTGPGASLAF